MAKQGNDDAAKILAKQLVRLRTAKTKSISMSARVSSINAQTTVSGEAQKGNNRKEKEPKIIIFAQFLLTTNCFF